MDRSLGATALGETDVAWRPGQFAVSMVARAADTSLGGRRQRRRMKAARSRRKPCDLQPARMPGESRGGLAAPLQLPGSGLDSAGGAVRGPKKSAVSEHDRRAHGVTSAHFALLSYGRCRRFHPRPRDSRPPSVRHVLHGDLGRIRSKSRTWGRFPEYYVTGERAARSNRRANRPARDESAEPMTMTNGIDVTALVFRPQQPGETGRGARHPGILASQAYCLEVHMLLEDHSTSALRDNPLDSCCILDPGASNMSHRSPVKNRRAHYG